MVMAGWNLRTEIDASAGEEAVSRLRLISRITGVRAEESP